MHVIKNLKSIHFFLLILFLFGLGLFFNYLISTDEDNDILPQGVGIPVILYHSIAPNPNPSELYAVSTDVFRNQLQVMKDEGYVSVDMEQLYDYFYKNGKLPRKAFMITFDDGRKDSYEHSDAILKELGFKAVMFMIPLMQENKNDMYLSWQTLNKMQASGRWDIQAHGYLFHNLIPIDEKGTLGDFGSNLMWLKDKKRLENFDEYKQRLSKDLIFQKEDIAKHIPAANVIAFAFPFGDWGTATQNMDKKLSIAINYELVNEVFPLSFGDVTFTLKDYERTTTPHLISRFMITGDDDIKKILDHFES